MSRNRKFSSKEKVAFHDRLLKIDGVIGKDFLNKVLVIDPALNVNRIQNVRYFRTVDFEILEHLESIYIPILKENKKKENA